MYRTVCYRCRKAAVMCYCAAVESFTSDPMFVILIHPKETRKAINTGRMAHLSLKNSVLIVGNDLTNDPILNGILGDASKRCILLFPGPGALDISKVLSPDGRHGDDSRQDVYIILDATWTMAKKMYRLSRNLQSVPQAMFHPPHRSKFVIREQPGLDCYSTIETIHHILELQGRHPAGEHHRLLEIFETMVGKQVNYEQHSRVHRSLKAAQI